MTTFARAWRVSRYRRKERDPNDEGEFAFGIDLILDGLERILARA